LASVEGKLQVVRESAKFLRAVIVFKAADPFFRSSVLFEDTLLVNAALVAWEIDNPGTVEQVEPVIVLTGPLLNPIITNTTNGCVLSYTGSIPSPRVVTIQTIDKEIIVTNDLGANLIGALAHSPRPEYFALDKGINELEVEDDTATTGTVTISFYPPYL
jgi:hypothetical protein